MSATRSYRKGPVPDLQRQFAERMKAEHERLSLTLEKIADLVEEASDGACKVSTAHLSRVENLLAEPSLMEAYWISIALNLAIEKLRAIVSGSRPPSRGSDIRLTLEDLDYLKKAHGLYGNITHSAIPEILELRGAHSSK